MAVAQIDRFSPIPRKMSVSAAIQLLPREDSKKQRKRRQNCVIMNGGLIPR
jgi:hypothetical protein